MVHNSPEGAPHPKLGDPYSSKVMGHRLQQDEVRRGKVMLINLAARLRVSNAIEKML